MKSLILLSIAIIALGFILPSYADTTGIVLKQTKNTDTYLDYDNGFAKSFLYNFDRILNYNDENGNPVYSNYIIQDSNNSISYQSATLSFTFEKNTCDIKVYSGGKIQGGQTPLINSLNIVLKEAVNGSDNWNLSTLNNLNCNATLSTTNDQIKITSTKSNHVFNNVTNISTGQDFIVTYIATPSNSNVEVVPSVTNLDMNNQTMKYGFTNTCNGLLCGHIQIAGVPLTNEVNATQLDNQTLTMQYNNNKIVYDPQNYIHNYLWAIKKIDSDNTVFDYTFAKNSLPYGETLTIDPTLTTPTGTFQRIGTLASAGISCAAANSKDTSINQFTLPDTTNNFCYLLDERFDLSSFNKTIVPLTTTFQFDISGVNNPQNCDYTQELNDPNSASFTTLWADITTGTKYVSNDSTCTTVATGKSVTLSSQATTDLFNALKAGQSWFAIGIKPIGTPLIRDASTHQETFANVKLSFTYKIPTAPFPPSSLTITTHTKSLGLSWVAPTFDGMNHAATLIQKYWIYFNTNWAYARQPLPVNGTTDNGGFTGAISMASNSLLLPFDFNNNTNLTTPEQSGNLLTVNYNNTYTNTFKNYANQTAANNDFPNTGTNTQINMTGKNLSWDLIPDPNTSNSHDVVSLSSTNWNYRFDFVLDHGTASATNPQGFFGVCSGDYTLTWNNAESCLGFYLTRGASEGYLAWATDSTQAMGSGSSGGASRVSFTWVVGTHYYFELKRTSATTFIVNHYSDPTYTTLVDSSTMSAIPAGVSNLHYLRTLNRVSESNSGTFNGHLANLKLSGQPITVNGLFTNAFYFGNHYAANNGVALVSSSINTVLKSADFTIRGWIKQLDTTHNNNLFAYNDTSNNKIAFGANHTYAYIKNGTSYIAQTAISSGVNDWNSFAFVHHAGAWAIYNNGTLQSNTTKAGTFINALSNKFYIGQDGQLTANAYFDEFAIWSNAQTTTNILNMFNRGFYSLTFSNQVGNVTSGTVSGLLDNTLYYVSIFSQNNWLNSTNAIIQSGTTATTPNAPILKVNAINQTALQIYFIDGSTGGDPITGHKLQRNGTLLQNNTALNPYVDNSLGINHQETYRACAWNSVGCSNFSGNVTNSTLAFPYFTIKIYGASGGNVGNITANVAAIKSLPNATVTQLQLFNKTTLMQTIAVSKVIQGNHNFTFPSIWQNVTFSNSYFTVNASGTILTLGGFNQRSNNVTVAAQFLPTYLPAPPGDNHTIAWNVTRINNNQNVILNVNRQPVTWKIECYIQTTLFDGFWDNHTQVGYFKPNYPVNAYNTVRGKCFNDVPLFNFTLPGNATGIAGFVALNGMMGSDQMFGAPSVLLYVLLFASLYTSRSAHTGIIATVAVIGILTVIGVMQNLNNVLWSLIFLLAAFGVFMGKKLF